MKISPELVRKLESIGGVYGQTVAPPAREPKPKEFVEPGIVIEPHRLVILVDVETTNETNARDWRARSRRSGQAWKRTRNAIGVHLGALEPFARVYASGGALKVKFTRLGGRHLDQMANLGASMKGVEDAMAYLLGADDGDPRWHAIAQQKPGGPMGVEVVLEVWQ